jgi:ubiquitin-conjugating enzyme E2 variant
MPTTMLGSSRSLSAEAAELALRPDSKPPAYKYSRSHRILEVCALAVSSSLTVLTGALVVNRLQPSGLWLAALACFGGLCIADFMSGLVHWSADTYGSPTMPIFGGFVRTFREHHADQVDITRHDFIETNGDVSIFSLPVHIALLCFVQDPYALACILGVFAGSYTNSQIHKWAHSLERPWLIRQLQRTRCVLSPGHHSRHHSGPHLTNYCITTGWMNPLLDSTRFFRALEWLLLKIGIRRTT